MSFFDHFSDSSSTRLGDWITRRTAQQEFALIRPYLPAKEAAILEIGPGMGDLAALCLAAGYRNYTIVEPNDSMRERLACTGVVAKNYLIPRLEEEDSSYDTIILSNVFEHLNGESQAGCFIAEAQRVLRPSGTLCLLSPDYLHWKEDFFNCDFSHNNVTSVRRAMQLFYNGGFHTLGYAYLSAFLTGAPATATSHLVRAGLFFADGNGMNQKLYKLKLTFLRRFLIVGQKRGDEQRPTRG